MAQEESGFLPRARCRTKRAWGCGSSRNSAGKNTAWSRPRPPTIAWTPKKPRAPPPTICTICTTTSATGTWRWRPTIADRAASITRSMRTGYADFWTLRRLNVAAQGDRQLRAGDPGDDDHRQKRQGLRPGRYLELDLTARIRYAGIADPHASGAGGGCRGTGRSARFEGTESGGAADRWRRPDIRCTYPRGPCRRWRRRSRRAGRTGGTPGGCIASRRAIRSLRWRSGITPTAASIARANHGRTSGARIGAAIPVGLPRRSVRRRSAGARKAAAPVPKGSSEPDGSSRHRCPRRRTPRQSGTKRRPKTLGGITSHTGSSTPSPRHPRKPSGTAVSPGLAPFTRKPAFDSHTPDSEGAITSANSARLTFSLPILRNAIILILVTPARRQTVMVEYRLSVEDDELDDYFEEGSPST